MVPESGHPLSHSPSDTLFCQAAELCGFLLTSLEPLPSSSLCPGNVGLRGSSMVCFTLVPSERLCVHFPGPTIHLYSVGLGALSSSANIYSAHIRSLTPTHVIPQHGPSTTHTLEKQRKKSPPAPRHTTGRDREEDRSKAPDRGEGPERDPGGRRTRRGPEPTGGCSRLPRGGDT